MRQPRNMNIIQIDITNACILQCSNCTRFCGHHKKPYFMDVETVKKAVDSLDGFNGTVSFMGGEPTLHPQFEEIANYLAQKHTRSTGSNKEMYYPQNKFMSSIFNMQLENSDLRDVDNGYMYTVNSPGLWSAMGEHYSKHYEIIQDTFRYQALNDHNADMYHDPILISRKELGIPDDEWEEIRDKCWIQNEWSASITPKGVFFCEVAGAMDMLFQGPGGLPIEPGWWKKDLTEFKEQFNWCEQCAVPCKTYTRNAKEEIDDVSPLIIEKLKEVDSPKLRKEKVNKVIIDENGVIADQSKASEKRFKNSMPYIESIQAKFDPNFSVLFPKGFEAVCHIKNELSEEKQQELASVFNELFDYVFIIFDNKNIQENFSVALNEKFTSYNLEDVVYSKVWEEILLISRPNHYISTFTDTLLPKNNYRKHMQDYIYNPGILIYGIDETLNEWVTGADFEDYILLNRKASSLKLLNSDYSKITTISKFKEIWNQEKILPLDELLFNKSIDAKVDKNKKYALYGTGEKSNLDYLIMSKNGLEFEYVVDSNQEKQGEKYNEYTIESTEVLFENKDKFDYIIVGTVRYYMDIKEMLIQKGFKEEQILCLKYWN